eukprot:jgi/Hompol1/5939/HPOL_004749-RA
MAGQDSRIPVGVLGATGTVGQRFIQLLEKHPQLRVHAVGASERSAGKAYGQVTNWKLDTAMPADVAQLVVRECEPGQFAGCRVIFSGLDSSVAGTVELAFLKADFAVFSNAKNHRMDPTVPLIVPLVNASHFDAVPLQRKRLGLQRGFLVTNANCATTGLVAALKPLVDAFGPLSRVVMVTMQAISGAGYPGVPSLDILGNVVPYISGEEEKVEEETGKILGSLQVQEQSQSGEQAEYAIVSSAQPRVSASCNRVAVVDGHSASVHIEFAAQPAPSPDQVVAVLRAYNPVYVQTSANTNGLPKILPSAPAQAIVVTDAHDRPQPRLDVNTGNGFSVVVGRVRTCPVFDIKFALLSHNTVIGAAGSSILNAEIAIARGLIN